MSSPYEDQEEPTIADPEVVKIYRASGEITTNALQKVIAACKPGVTVLSLCDLGDKTMLDQLKSRYAKAEKGIAFPTCVSLNNICGHFNPLKQSPAVAIKEGDVVKIQLGAQINGFAALSAFTIVVSGDKPAEINDKRADVIAAAFTACDAAKRMIRPGKKNTEVTEVIQKVADAYGVKALEGVLSHEMRQYVIDGDRVIIQAPNKDMRVEEIAFEENEVFTIDIIMSTGSGKPTQRDEKTSVYKRSIEAQYFLKLAASRALFNEINKKAPAFPFSLRTIMDDEKKARLGITEMLQHDMLEPYPVLFEQDGEFVAHFMTTVLCAKSTTSPLNMLGLPTNIKSAKTCTDESVVSALAFSTKKRANKPKKAAKPAEDEKEKEPKKE